MTLSGIYKKILQEFKIEPPQLIKLIVNKFNITEEKFWRDGEKIKVGYLKKIILLKSIKRICRKVPLAYITGEKYFYSNRFIVRRGVLIPRPETEILVESVLKYIKEGSKVLDIGSGTGIIGITIAKMTNGEVYLLEKYRKALKILNKNVRFHKIKNKVKIIKGDLFPIGNFKFELIVSNPPYISKEEMKTLDHSVRDHEPETALNGGEDGLEIIKRIIEKSPNYLTKNGRLFLEAGHGHADKVASIMEERGFINIEIFKDYSGIKRVIGGMIENSSDQSIHL